jgi:hypothetical protein
MSAVATLSSATAAQFPMFPIPSTLLEAGPSVKGVVQDRSGAVIPNAKVDVTEDASGRTLTMRADSFGRFRFSSVAVGAYTIRIASPGFELLTGPVGVVTREINLVAKLEVGEATMGGAIVAVAPK